jgi:flagellar biogenesis protein FliO
MRSPSLLKRSILVCFLSWIAVSLASSIGWSQSNDAQRKPVHSGEPTFVRGPARTMANQTEQTNPPMQRFGTGNTNGSPVSQASFSSSVAPTVAQPGFERSSSVELKPPSKTGAGSIDKPTSNWGAMLSVLFSLAIVLCVFFGIAWMAKRSLPQSSSKLPTEVVQVLGRTTLAPRQQVYVVRFGKRLLLVSQQPGHTQTLGEIDDDQEVERLAGICEAAQPSSSSRSFSDVLKQVAYGKTERPTARRRTA